MAAETSGDFIYFQDDDCVLPEEAHRILCQCARLAPRGAAVLHISPERDVPWVGWGAIVPRDLWQEPHARYLERWPRDQDFLDFCDVIFTMQVPVRRCFVRYRDLPWAESPSRTSNQPGYYTDRRPMMLNRIRELVS